MQTILGSGGAIGVELARSLTTYTTDIRLVSRNPYRVNDSDKLFTANLLNKRELFKAVEGSDVVYVTIGFAYNLKVWQQNWPVLIDNVIEACKRYSCKLVFFDNIYMYDPEFLDGMTEETPFNPSSRKGKVREEVVKKILDAKDKGEIKGLIARCADYYGPGIGETSVLNETVVKPLVQGKTANWMGPLSYKHSFTYTPDAGKATAMLGNTEDAYNQTWHLPTSSNPPTGKEWVEMIASVLSVKPKVRATSRLMMKILGLFIPVLREMPEMMYQYDRHYDFNSDKFEQYFTFKPTPYIDGVNEMINRDYPNIT